MDKRSDNERILEMISLIARLNKDLENANAENKQKVYGIPAPFYIITGLIYIFFREDNLVEKDCTEVYRQDSINGNDLVFNYITFKVVFLTYLREKYFKNNDNLLSTNFYCMFLIDTIENNLKQRLLWDLYQLLKLLRDSSFSETMNIDLVQTQVKWIKTEEIIPFDFNTDGILQFILINLSRIPEGKIVLNEFQQHYNYLNDRFYLNLKTSMKRTQRKKWFGF
jgi:hypothetical protein